MKRINVFIFAIAFFTVSGCSKILDQKPLTGLLPENAIGTAENAESLLSSAYAALREGKMFGECIINMAEIPGDNTTTVNSALLMLENFTWNPTSGYIDGPYTQGYNAIAKANFIIDLVGNADMDAARRDQIKGEALFIRALTYFYLVRFYGALPLYTKPVLSGDQQTIQENAQAARSSVDSVYALITSDLDMAATLVAETQTDASRNRYRAIKTTVNALQAKVYLYLRQWDKATVAAQKVIASPLYSLPADFNSLWPAKGKAEAVFEINYNPPLEGGGVIPDEILPFPLATYSFDKFPRPVPDFIENVADRTNDKRFKFVAPVNFNGVHVADNYTSFLVGLPNNLPGGGGAVDLGYFIYKWRNVGALPFNNPDNYSVLRLADIKLIYAEAENELNGPGNALAPLNEIRTRAGLTALTLANVPDKTSFRNEVDRQRRLELAFEGERWMDLVRYANAKTAGIPHTITALDIIKQVRGSEDANYLLFPIPQGEVNSNPNVKQNPGY
ncbi:RagB/SusD family nutrient uptake outer membrane protein [Chitinophaga sp. MM2321]|uniref:RagB/SusD family nutrient uptake outer membrane protein n=1 Tax=Chitinophaga sp. MM2321 TaxID=3137178 RepID=UPI0032D577F4